MKIVSKIITATIIVAVFITAALMIIDHGRGDIFPTFWFSSSETVETSPTDMPTPEVSETPAPTLEPTPTLTPEPTPEPEPEYFVLSFAGDCTFACDKSQSTSPYNFNAVVGDNFAFPFQNVVSYLENDEFSMINLECAITDSTSARDKTFTFRADEKYLALFSQGSLEFANLANNHSYDFFEAGFEDTVSNLASIGVGCSVHGESTIYITDNGLKIGVYATDYDTAPLDPTEGIAALKAQSPDIIIYSPHWGIEGWYTLAADQIENSHKAIDAGADIVFGTHPHVLQKIEEYNGKYIFYSLGNFIFGGNTAPRDRDSAIIQVTVERSPDGIVSLIGYEAIPCALSSVAAYNNYQPTPYAEGSAEYERAMSKLLGTFTGPNLVVDYSFMHQNEEQQEESAPPADDAASEPEGKLESEPAPED